MTKLKIPPEAEALISRAREARVEGHARRGHDPSSHPDAEHLDAELLRDLVTLARSHPRITEDMGVLKPKIDKRRVRIRRAAERGYLRRWAVNVLAEAFSDTEIVELLALDEEGQEAKARKAERRSEREEAVAMTRQVEREREQEARQSAEAEAARRLGAG